jgi:hypothetical protein
MRYGDEGPPPIAAAAAAGWYNGLMFGFIMPIIAWAICAWPGVIVVRGIIIPIGICMGLKVIGGIEIGPGWYGTCFVRCI